MFRNLGIAIGLLAGVACGGGSESPAAASSSASQCAVPGQNTFVRDALQEYYFWYRQLPNPDPAGFSSPEAYLEAVRYRPLDQSFSFITGKAEDQAFFSDSQFIGIGFTTLRSGASDLRVAQVFPDSPASEAGFQRGDDLLTINGRAVADLIRTGEINTAFGPNQVGVAATISWRSAAGGERQASVVKRLVTIPTVSGTEVFDVRGARVGYVHFRNFVQPSVDALNAAFGQLLAEGVDELVLDLRYNGGGLVSVAQHLGGLIGGQGTSGQVFAEFFHNDKQTARNRALRFEDPPAALDLPRVFVIQTRASASASEAVVNGLRPFIPVVVVGDTSYGKPVGQYGFDFCEKVFYPVAFTVRNARGESDYFAGIPPDCAAADDLEHPLGDAAEASLAEALDYVRTGGCSGRAAGAAAANAARRARLGPLPGDGWQQLLNAN